MPPSLLRFVFGPPALRLRGAAPAMACALCLAIAACATRDAQAGRTPAPLPAAAAVAASPPVRHVALALADDAPEPVTYGGRDDVRQFAADVARRHGLNAADVQALLGEARFQPSVARLVMPAPAGVAKNWAAYRRRFVQPARIAAGVAFWNDNARWLALAEERYGVPASVIVGIVGVETDYGRQMGGFRQIDALATLAFDFPTGRSDRSAYFRGELETWLVDNLALGRAALDLKSSYAGARGLPQFMPSNVAKLGVDFDGDGQVDLAASAADAIGSIANFLVAHGWQRGLPARCGVTPPDRIAALASLLAPDIVPSFTAAEMTAAGARLAPDAAALPADTRLALVRLDNADDPPSYVAGTANFYAVTRYNQSSYYALGVIELGEAVQAAR